MPTKKKTKIGNTVAVGTGVTVLLIIGCWNSGTPAKSKPIEVWETAEVWESAPVPEISVPETVPSPASESVSSSQAALERERIHEAADKGSDAMIIAIHKDYLRREKILNDHQPTAAEQLALEAYQTVIDEAEKGNAEVIKMLRAMLHVAADFPENRAVDRHYIYVLIKEWKDPLSVVEDPPPAVPQLKPLATLIVANFHCPACEIQETKVDDVAALGFRVNQKTLSVSPMPDGAFPVWHYQMPDGKWRYSHTWEGIKSDLRKSGGLPGVQSGPSALGGSLVFTKPCGCGGLLKNEWKCPCRQHGLPCHCTPSKVSVHKYDAEGRWLGKTGEYVDPRQKVF